MAKRSNGGATSPQAAFNKDTIVIRGARVHNLKNVNLDLPRKKLIVVTGVSGSGKSSLAFDTIYAEGQRRYVESLSSYARQFLERMDKPDVDLIQGISPAMAIEQKTNTRNPRSTVGTTTEIYDYLRVLFARIGKTYCYNCGRLVTRDTVRTILDSLTQEAGDVQTSSLKLYITFPLPIHHNETVDEALSNLKKEGFFRVVVKNEIVDLNESEVPKKIKPAEVQVLVDRVMFTVGEENNRLADSIETAFASGGGNAEVVLLENNKTLKFTQNFECSHCRIRYEEPDPRLFSFNNPFGACPECQGFGKAIGIDMELVVPMKSKTLREGAIQPWSTPKFKENEGRMVSAARQAGVRLDVPFSDLSETEQQFVMEGHGDFDGINGFFKMLEKKSYKIYYRVLLSRYRGYTTCAACGGARLRKEALNIKVAEKGIADIVRMTIAEAGEFFASLSLTHTEREIAKRILEELDRRLKYLNEVGIGYLTLDRLSNTLSGGESQRINLATSLGSSLVGALYVLDEPSIGLHPRDNGRLINILKALRDVGNTVLVVEHDSDMMRESDIIVDMGPKAGEFGGEIVYAGPSGEIVTDQKSLTGKYLSGKRSIAVPRNRRLPNSAAVIIEGAAENNLKGIDVTIPLHMFVCITGVSGSGKSTLVHDVLYSGLKRLKGEPAEKTGRCSAIRGHEHISSVEMVDQSPIGRSPRSNPITYIQIFDHIRNLFAATQAAKIHGFLPGHFSFNVPGGRCEACEGDGVVKVEMQFLADLYLICDSCKGARYKQEVLDVHYHGKNITDVLGMTVTEAIQFFSADATGRKVARKLKVLEDVGLGYIRLGQSATSLSGGEAQRIKLAAHLSAPQRGTHTLFIFDEPTTGLHFDDIAKLLTCFSALIDQGHSVVIIEHNLDVIKCADYVIDLGPEAGGGGGEIVGQGTPEKLAKIAESHTGRFLRRCLFPEKSSK
ncbi:MAG: excinuclease ABC subunit UvrA [Bacteroidetes bacterium]|nr:excinuclease ABC subunit UvrA [Bacteroidota bacterium]MCW5894995.1 excinuclease ABC subunit UvrA [Bacteroidota bacterium]